MVMLAGKKIIRQKSFQFGSMENLLLNFKSMIYNDKKNGDFFLFGVQFKWVGSTTKFEKSNQIHC